MTLGWVSWPYSDETHLQFNVFNAPNGLVALVAEVPIWYIFVVKASIIRSNSSQTRGPSQASQVNPDQEQYFLIGSTKVVYDYRSATTEEHITEFERK